MTAREQAIETIAEAMWAARHDGNAVAFENMHPTGKALYRKMATAALDALLAAAQDEPCPTCLGTHTLRLEHGSTQCPNCTDGRIPGAPLVILGPEQIGWYFGPGMSVTHDKWDDDLVAVFTEPAT